MCQLKVEKGSDREAFRVNNRHFSFSLAIHRARNDCVLWFLFGPLVINFDENIKKSQSVECVWNE